VNNINRIRWFPNDPDRWPLVFDCVGGITGVNDERNIPVCQEATKRDRTFLAQAKIDDGRGELGVVRDGPSRIQIGCGDDTRTGPAKMVFYVDGDQGFIFDKKYEPARKQIQGHHTPSVRFRRWLRI
jgi:hypothetical protein